jgi:hypothetical protein
MKNKRAIVLAGLAIVTAFQTNAIADEAADNIAFANCFKRTERWAEREYQNWRDEGTGLTWTQTPIDRQVVTIMPKTRPVVSHLGLISIIVFAKYTCTPPTDVNGSDVLIDIPQNVNYNKT